MKTQPKAAENSFSYSQRGRTGEARMEISHSQENPTSAQTADIHLLQQSGLVPFNLGPTDSSERTADDTREQPAW